MWMNLAKAALVTVATAGWIGCQQPDGVSPPVESPPGGPGAGSSAEKSVGEWIEQLGSDRYEDREAAGRVLESMGASAAQELRNAAERHADVDVQLRARKILQRIESKEAVSDREAQGFRRLAPRDQVAPGPLDGGDRRRASSPFDGFETLFRDGLGPDVDALRRQMDELRRQLDEGIRLPGFGGTPGLGSGTSISITPDGVRVEVQEIDENGERSSQVFEAPDLETLRREHPEIAERLLPGGMPGGLQRVLPMPDGFQPTLPGLRQVPFGGQIGLAPPGPGEVLGVRVEALDPALSDYLELQPGRGLLVRAVEPGSLAAAAGLEIRDVVMAVGDQQIRTVADVRTALRAIAGGEPVVVEVNRFGKALRLETVKQHDAPVADGGGDRAQGSEDSSSTPQRLRRRN